jgi:hypothetical protein
MKPIILSLALALSVSGCALLSPDGRDGPITGPSAVQPATEFAPTAASAALGARAVSATDLDTTTEAEKAAALNAPAPGGERRLGTQVVALGPPAEQGLWLSSELVTQVVQGRVLTGSGQSLAVELRPGTGGALLSLAAYQALGLTLTDLPELTIFGP